MCNHSHGIQRTKRFSPCWMIFALQTSKILCQCHPTWRRWRNLKTTYRNFASVNSTFWRICKNCLRELTQCLTLNQFAQTFLTTLINSHQLLAGTDFDVSFRSTSGNIQSTLMQLLFSFDWDSYESWENCHANSRFSTLINSDATLVLVWPGNESWENSHANSRFSTLINSHATLVLVWPGHESWENSHANSRFSTLINSHATLE
jgi:hypothetical protein